uniref:Uncharacterized protein n=1 Tax=Parascaris equorum TaxID=6256 RepID=A0A914RAQ3_PAREQ
MCILRRWYPISRQLRHFCIGITYRLLYPISRQLRHPYWNDSPKNMNVTCSNNSATLLL